MIGFNGRFVNRPSKMYYPAVDELFLFNTSAQRRNRPPRLAVDSICAFRHEILDLYHIEAKRSEPYRICEANISSKAKALHIAITH